MNDSQNLDEAHSSLGLHAAAGPGLAEECATLVCYVQMPIFKFCINVLCTTGLTLRSKDHAHFLFEG